MKPKMQTPNRTDYLSILFHLKEAEMMIFPPSFGGKRTPHRFKNSKLATNQVQDFGKHEMDRTRLKETRGNSNASHEVTWRLCEKGRKFDEQWSDVLSRLARTSFWLVDVPVHLYI